MSKLANIPQVDQAELLNLYKFSIREGENILVLGPSGAGKTDMAYEACQSNDMNCIYWNMSVMERPDIQGLPVVSSDKKTATFAPNEGMPFVGIEDIKNYRALTVIVEALINSESNLSKVFLNDAQEKLAQIKEKIAKTEIANAHGLFDETKLRNQNINPLVKGNEESKNILLLDEVDKTPPENLQPLLELLLYRSINGKALDIKSVIMTANLPDEQAYSEPLSHAITNRAMIVELKPSSNVWLNWGKEHNLHPTVIGFLSRQENAAEYFNKRPGNNEMYSYAYTTPRAWAKTSKILYKFEKYEKEKQSFISKEKLISSIIGEEATTKLIVWLDFYQKYNSLIDEVFDGSNAKSPDENDAKIVIALALANKFTRLAKDSNDVSFVQKKASHVFRWIEKNTTKDVMLCSMRSAYQKDYFMKHKLHEFPDTKTMWEEVMNMYKAVNEVVKL